MPKNGQDRSVKTARRRKIPPEGEFQEDVPEGHEGTGEGEPGDGDVIRDDTGARPPRPRKGDAAPGLQSAGARRILELLDKHQEDRPRGKRARPQVPKKFEFVEHTADVGVRAFGDTVGKAFENAALGMLTIMTDPSKVNPLQDFQVIVEGDDLNSLLHDWLAQVLVLTQVNGMLFSDFRVEMKTFKDHFSLTGWAIGEPADPNKHVYKTEIKAVTRHLMEVREDPPSVNVLFDL